VIDASELDTSVVRVGSLVSGKDEKGKDFSYTIVGSTEADPRNGRLSNESPVGKALVGRQKGETVTVPAPKGERKLTISKIGVA
jgi:transcription elongation factor GreA